MKTISKYDFTRNKYIVLDEKERLVLELETGEQYIATPTDFPEEDVILQIPQEYMEVEEKMLEQAEEMGKKLRKKIFGDENPKFKRDNKEFKIPNFN